MEQSLNVTEQLKGKTILLYGGTGFLGKVWMSLVSAHFQTLNIYTWSFVQGNVPMVPSTKF